MKRKQAFISLLVVDPSQRGQGIGKKLLQAFRERCLELGIGYISLFAPSNYRGTLEFYKKAGFTQGKQHKLFSQ